MRLSFIALTVILMSACARHHPPAPVAPPALPDPGKVLKESGKAAGKAAKAAKKVLENQPRPDTSKILDTLKNLPSPTELLK